MAATAVDLKATGSAGRTVLLMEAAEAELRKCLEEAKRGVLLGCPPEAAVNDACSRISHQAISNGLLSVLASKREVPEEGEDAESMVSYASLAEETKVPLFIAVSFFAPIMLLLLVLLGGQETFRAIAEVVALDIIILDVAFTFSAAERRRLNS